MKLPKELVHDDDKEDARLSGAEESYGGYENLEKAHSEVGGEEEGNLRGAWRSAPTSSRAACIHKPTRCGPRGDSVSEILSSRTKGLVSNIPSVYRELLINLLADFLMYYCTKPTPKIETRYQSAKSHSAQLFTGHPVS